jgi:gliding motility-associated-like protein
LAQGNYFLATGGVSPYESGTVDQTTTLYVYVQQGTCSAEESFVVTVVDTPVFTFDQTCDDNDYVISVVPANGFDPSLAQYEWSEANGADIDGDMSSQSVIALAPGDYTVTVSIGDCSSTQSFNTTSVQCTIQKGISVNGDGDNDTLDLTGQDVRQLNIFNRYGMVVYSRANYINEWGGQSDKGEELPDGTYYFVIERGSGDTKSGWIYLNRAQN